MVQIHRSTTAVISCIACIFGMGLGTMVVVPISIDTVMLGSIFGIVGICIVQHTYTRLLFFIVFFFCMGIIRTFFIPTYEENRYDQKIEFDALVVREPDISVDKQRLIVRSPSIHGLIQLHLPLQPRYTMGQELQIGCTLQKPEPFEEFQYDRYLQRYGISSLCSYPYISVIGYQRTWKSELFRLKYYLTNHIQHTISSPEHTLILGAVFGLNHALPADIAEDFRVTGTMHLLVISGSNVVIITSVLLSLFKSFPLSRRTAIWVIICILFIYAIFTGWQPPAVRATFFGSITLIASLLGRSGSALRLLILVATLMLCINPLLLFYDAGFQLSFLATAGIIVFSTPLEQKLSRIPEIVGLRTATAVTLSAMLTTSPLIAYSFQSFSLIALVANIVMGPLMTIMMLGGIVAVFISVLVPEKLAIWLTFPLYEVIHFSLAVVRWCARVPYASISLPIHSTWILCTLYVAITIFGWRVLKKFDEV